MATLPPDDHPFLTAIQFGSREEVQAQIREGINVNAEYPIDHQLGDSLYPLQLAVASNRFDMVETLVDGGARVDRMDFLSKGSFSTLMVDTFRQPDFNPAMIDVLAKAGMDLNGTAVDPRYPSHRRDSLTEIALSGGHHDTAKALIRNGADLPPDAVTNRNYGHVVREAMVEREQHQLHESIKTPTPCPNLVEAYRSMHRSGQTQERSRGRDRL